MFCREYRMGVRRMVRAAGPSRPWCLAIRGVLAFALCAPVMARADGLLVFAAASLKPSLDAILAMPEAAALGARASYAASSQLARQIEAGAPAALFISADQDWMDHVERHALVVEGTRANLVGNALVLVAPKDSATKLDIAPGFALAAALGKDGRLALAEPNSVPAGKYAKAALTKLGIWDGVATRVVAADDVRAALNFVARGEAVLGVVYRSDAVSEPAVRVVATFPEATHAPIVYPVAILAGHDAPAARKLLDLLRAPAGRAIFREHGFDAPPE
jgi:molybdate transport system substrate-binding protein